MAGYSVTYSVVDNATKQIDAINRRITQMRAPMDRMSRSISRFVDVSGLRKVAEGFGWIGRAAATAFRAMIAIVPVLGAITSAATIAGIAKLVSSFSAWGRQLTISADQIGISTQQLQQFEDAARLAGGTTEEMTGSLKSLKEISTQAFLGINLDALAYFNRYSINLRDVNGHLRNTADLMPEVIDKLTNITDAEERGRVAMQLLGAEGVKLVETIRVSGKSFAQYYADAGKFTELTQAQIQEMIKFEQAQGRLGVAFDHLGQQVAAVLAENFTPLFDHLSEFVTTHQPEIIAAVDQLSARFSKWLDNPDMWKAIGDGLTKTIDGLKWMVDNLDTVLHYAEVIAAVFAVKWALGIAASIAQVTLALGAVSGGVSAGTGLLGALGAVAALATTLALKGDTGPGGPGPATPEQKQDAAKSAEDINKRQGYTGDFWHDMGVGISRGAGAVWDRIVKGPESIRPPASPSSFTPTAPELTPEGKGLLSTIAAHESRGDYSVLYGGGHFAGSQFPQWAGKDNSHAAGAYQFQPATFAGVQGQRPDIKDFSPANQDRAAWQLAQTDYHRRTGRDLAVDLKDPSKAQDIANALQPTWTSTNKPGWAKELQANLAKSAPVASAPPAAMPPAAPPINGSVSVDITHRNPPPDASVTAKGSGSVNVAPPRVEHAALADI